MRRTLLASSVALCLGIMSPGYASAASTVDPVLAGERLGRPAASVCVPGPIRKSYRLPLGRPAEVSVAVRPTRMPIAQEARSTRSAPLTKMLFVGVGF